jgi:hypothetical protein
VTNVSEVLTGSMIREIMMMEAVNACGMLVNFYETTWRNIPEDGIFKL